MNGRLRTARLLFCVLLLSATAGAQERPVPSSLERAREHAVSIARELLAHLPPDSLGRVAVSVEGIGARFLVENAMIETLRSAGLTAVLKMNAPPQDPVLRMFILEQARSSMPSADGRFVRTVRTAIEGRMDRPGVGFTLLGAPIRTSVDTVLAAESGPLAEAEEESNVFDSVLTPVIVISGVALVVYLLFTVRS